MWRPGSVQAGARATTLSTPAGSSSSTTTSGASNTQRLVTVSVHSRLSPGDRDRLFGVLLHARSVTRRLPKSLAASSSSRTGPTRSRRRRCCATSCTRRPSPDRADGRDPAFGSGWRRRPREPARRRRGRGRTRDGRPRRARLLSLAGPGALICCRSPASAPARRTMGSSRTRRPSEDALDPARQGVVRRPSPTASRPLRRRRRERRRHPRGPRVAPAGRALCFPPIEGHGIPRLLLIETGVKRDRPGHLRETTVA
jgi:hypothetical protein